MSEFESTITDGEFIGPSPLLRNVLVDATLKPGRSISHDIDMLDLGVFVEEARLLANDCFIDPENNNFAKMVYVTGAKKVLVPKSVFKGSRSEITMFGAVATRSKQDAVKNQTNDRYISMLMQTYINTDLILAKTGVDFLMRDDSFPLALSSLFIAGKTQNALLFRGESSPQWSEKEANDRSNLWSWQLEERIRQHSKSGMSLDQKTEIARRAERMLLRQICQKYDLSFFVGSTDSQIVTKQTS